MVMAAAVSRRWKDGHCSYGEGCKYAHGEAELRANIVAAQQFEGLPGPGAPLTHHSGIAAPIFLNIVDAPQPSSLI